MSEALVVLYGLKRCDTCVKARRWLDARGITYEFVDYRDEPVAASVLQDWAQQLGGWERLVNKSSTTWRQLPETQRQPADEQAWLELVLAHPTLVRRPVCVMPDGSVSVGFREKEWQARWEAV